MKKKLMIIACLFLAALSCKTQKQNVQNQIQQGIEGYVLELSGNNMPMLNRNHQPANHQPKPLAATVYIYAAAKLKDVVQINHSPLYSSIHTKLVAVVQSDSTGYFKVNLSAGKYSIFIKQKDNYYANSFDAENNIALVVVNKNVFTKVTIKADVNAVY